ncbi:hypothetical protein [Glacieibacterium frigidum]|uniref:Uncharacterized protein n=1 Tax=Glacieibacterium frigidum TaxID=2593303 RepID=A0A552U6Z1_9SPHN|nr:hypothetical protein [Glacieibacterium frigidum]TRW13987.1 hypothetical protein FMM06_09590 [Glacieibacterium frigidum]
MRVVGDGPRPQFDVTYDRGKTACVQGMNVTDLTGGTRRMVWAIRQIDASKGAPCAANIRFGVTPVNYEIVVAPERLLPGRKYEVNASGIGWQADAPVVVR